MSNLLCFGLNHQSAPLAMLERLSLGAEEMESLLRDLVQAGPFDEVAGLSTCNRTEFYFTTRRSEAAAEYLLQRLDSRSPGLQADDIRYYGYLHNGYQATTHLFRVAAGVDSMMVGESQILGQLRRAWETAQSLGTVGGTLNNLFSRAVGFGRKVRSETNISRGNISVAAVAEKIASSMFGELASRTALMLGAGETAELAAGHLHKAGLGTLCVLNRTLEHSERLAERFGGQALAVDLLQSGIQQSDIVVAATGAPHYIVSAAGVEQIMTLRGDRPLLLIDLSLPRNIQPECAEIPGVTLYSMQDLEGIALENRRHREAEVSLVEELIDRETRDFLREAAAADSERLIAGLRRKSEEIRLAHLERFTGRLDDAERAKFDRYSDSLLRAVLHDLTAALRSSDLETEEGRQRLEAARDLFQLDPRHLDSKQ